MGEEEVVGERYQYIMFNKPAGVVSATVDRDETTVVEYVRSRSPRHLAKDLFPMGRLDKDTRGLLVLTNDGDMAHRLLSPARHVPKKYYVVAHMEIISGNECFLTITEGKYHQIKRMFRCLGKTVVGLKRVEMAGLKLDESLAEGEWRFLTEEEIEYLKTL